MDINLTPLMNAVISLCAALITAHLIPWLYTKKGAEQADKLMKWAKIGVQAAEQLYHSRMESGDEKKLYVIKFLESKGFRLDTEEVEQAIEAAVYEMKKSVTESAVSVTEDNI